MTGKALVGRVSTTPRHFREGLEAALRAEPYTLAITKPRTVLGMMVKVLALEAARGEIKAVQLVLAELAADPEKGSQGRSQAHSQNPTCGSAAEPATGDCVAGRNLSKKAARWDRTEEGWDVAEKMEPSASEERAAKGD